MYIETMHFHVFYGLLAYQQRLARIVARIVAHEFPIDTNKTQTPMNELMI